MPFLDACTALSESPAIPANVAAIEDFPDVADNSAIEPVKMAVSPDDAEDDGWVTDEEDKEEHEDDEDETNEIPFNDDQVWECLGSGCMLFLEMT